MALLVLAAPTLGIVAVGVAALAWATGLALLTAVALFLLAGRARRRRGPPRIEGPARAASGRLRCATCGAAYPAGTVFCSRDATRLAAPSPERLGGGTCPRCHRVYAAGSRFCAQDAEELVPLHRHGDGGESRGSVVTAPGGKICPTCTTRYALEETFCGRDGAELSSVN